MAAAPQPEQFAVEIEHLMDTVADEARESWNVHIAQFNAKPWCRDGCAEPAAFIHHRVREMLKAVVDQLVIDAWAAHKERLTVDFKAPQNELVELGQPALARGTHHPRRELIAKRIERVRLDKEMSIGRLAVESGVDKKTLIGILHCRRDATPITLKRLADTLGIPVAELAAS